MLLTAIVMPWAVCAQRTDSVRWEHEVKINEIVVMGLTGGAPLKNTPQAITAITGADLFHSASTNIIDAVSQQPGMAQVTTGGGIAKPVIRGLGYNRVVVVHDGVRQEGQQWGDEHGIEIDEQAVGAVEILKGPASLMYGSDALAGVLVLNGHPLPAVGRVSANATAEYQTNNGLFGYSVDAEGNHGGVVWSSRWSQKLAHAYKNAVDGYVSGSAFREEAFRQMVGMNGSWGYSHLTLSYYHQTPSIIEGGTPTAFNGHSYGRTLPFQQIHHYKAVLNNTLLLGEGNVKATLGYQQNRRQEYEETAQECGLDFLLHTVNYDVRYTSPELLDGWKLVAGIGGMVQRSLNEGSEYLVPAYRLFDYGLFVTASRDLQRWHFCGGLRYDRRHLKSEALTDEGQQRFAPFARNFAGLTGSLGAVYNLSSTCNVRLNIARGFRAPNISELGSNGEHEGTARYELGNNQLKSESSWQVDLGADYSLPWMFVKASLFASRIADYIFIERMVDVAGNALVTDGCDTYQYCAGTARLLGGELLLDIHPVGRLHFENTFSYVDAVQLAKHGGERYLPFTPSPRWTSDVRVDLCKASSTVATFGLDYFFRQRHVHSANGTETATPSYPLFSVSLSSDLKVGRRRVATLSIVCSNLFNKVYQSHLSRLKYLPYNETTGRMGVYNMGRNFCMKLLVPLCR